MTEKRLVALDLLYTILSKVYTKITNETNEKIKTNTEEIATIKELLTTNDDINTLSSEYSEIIEAE